MRTTAFSNRASERSENEEEFEEKCFFSRLVLTRRTKFSSLNLITFQYSSFLILLLLIFILWGEWGLTPFILTVLNCASHSEHLAQFFPIKISAPHSGQIKCSLFFPFFFFRRLWGTSPPWVSCLI